ncbi:hypothetical protein PAMP_014814 [Pampus punctatissimus]
MQQRECAVFEAVFPVELLKLGDKHHAELREHHATSAAVVCGDDTVLLTPGRMSQRQVKERDKEREREKEKEAGLQTPNREHVATPSTLSPGVSYTHGKQSTCDRESDRDGERE